MGDEAVQAFRRANYIRATPQADGGIPVVDVCGLLGVSEAAFYVCKTKYGQHGVSKFCEMRQSRDENARLKQLVANLTLDTLDKHVSSEVIRKSLKPAVRTRYSDSGALPGEHRALVTA